MSNIRDYFKYFIKKYQTAIDYSSKRIYVHKIEKGIKFRIKKVYYLKLLMSVMVKLLESTKNKVTKD